jgi:hypothetical protein
MKWRGGQSQVNIWNFLASPKYLVAGENYKKSRGITCIGIVDDLIYKMTQNFQLKCFLACMCQMRQL